MVADRLRRSALGGLLATSSRRSPEARPTITNSFLLTGTSEEDKKFLDEPIEIEIKQS